jgi:hypothetical protein
MIMPWKQRWVLLTMEGLKIYQEEDPTTFKAELIFDERTRVAFAEHSKGNLMSSLSSSPEPYKFCVITATSHEEFSTTSVQQRNMWINNLATAAASKSDLGSFVVRLDSDLDFRNFQKWEEAVITHNVDRSSGLMTYDTVEVDVFDPTTGAARKEKRLAAATRDDFNYSSFLPFENWLERFEPDTIRARERMRREDELRQKGIKVDEPTAGDRMRDYMVEKIVERYSNNATPKICNLLLEGMCQVIARSERLLARQYHLTQAAGEGKALVSNPQLGRPEGEGIQGESRIEVAKGISDLDRASVLVKGEAGSATEIDTTADVPVEVQEDLIAVLGSLRALICTYRFDVTGREAQMQYTRRLAINCIVRGITKMLTTLSNIATEVIYKAVQAGEEVVEKEGEKSSKPGEHLSKQEKIQRGTVSEEETSKFLRMKKSGELRQTAEGVFQRGGKEGEGGKEQQQSQQGRALEQGPDQQEGGGEEGSTLTEEQRQQFRHKGAELRESALERLRGILRPQLTRVRDQVAPLVQEFAERNNVNLQELEGIAADVTNTVGGKMIEFVERKSSELEDTIAEQMEIVQQILLDLKQKGKRENVTADELLQRSVQKSGEVATTNPTPATAQTHIFLSRLEHWKSALQSKLAEVRGGAGTTWYGTDREVVELVALDRCNFMYAKLHNAAKQGSAYAMLAMLFLIGTGMSSENAPTSSAPGSEMLFNMPPPPTISKEFF